MAFQIYWYIDGTVSVNQLWHEFSIEELEDNNRQITELVRAGEPPVHNLLDIRYLQKYPMKINVLTAATSIFREPNLGWTIAISENNTANFLLNLVTSMARTQVKVVKTIDDALLFLESIDNRITELPPYADPPTS